MNKKQLQKLFKDYEGNNLYIQLSTSEGFEVDTYLSEYYISKTEYEELCLVSDVDLNNFALPLDEDIEEIRIDEVEGGMAEDGFLQCLVITYTSGSEVDISIIDPEA